MQGKIEFESILKLNPCPEAVDWLKTKDSIEQAYHDCERGDWLLWLAAKVGIDRKLIVLAACDCAEQALRYVPDGENRPKRAIEAARAWTRGEAGIEDVREAADAAASAAADAAYAANAAANAAADAAANAANAALIAFDAAYAAYAAASAAAYAAYAANAAADAAASAASASYAAARAGSLKGSTKIVRRHISLDLFKEKLK